MKFRAVIFILLTFFIFLFGALTAAAQTDSLNIPKNLLSEAADSSDLKTASAPHFKNRQKLVGYGSIAAYGGLLYALNKAWYSKYPRTSFHFYNDNGEWNQMDKVGHGWTAYQLTRASYAAWKWAGASDKKALTLSGISGPAFLTVIEILDGFSDKWGFSWGDMNANLLGSGLFIGQQLLWNEQRIGLRFSFYHKKYSDPMLENRAASLFGKTWYERMLKDYNAQTYWLSANIRSFFPKSKIPAWLNIAVGYGADGMFGGYENKWTDAAGNTFERTDIKRTRQFYIAPDIDLTRIKTNSRFLRSAFFLINSIRIPTPALMIDNKGKVQARLFNF